MTVPWMTPTVRVIAQTIWDQQRWCDLPVLADAAEEAGYAHSVVLSRMRDGETATLGRFLGDGGALLPIRDLRRIRAG